jgi:hypothetical protein
MSRAADELGPASRLSGSSQLQLRASARGVQMKQPAGRRVGLPWSAIGGSIPAARTSPSAPRVFQNGRTGLSALATVSPIEFGCTRQVWGPDHCQWPWEGRPPKLDLAAFEDYKPGGARKGTFRARAFWRPAA